MRVTTQPAYITNISNAQSAWKWKRGLLTMAIESVARANGSPMMCPNRSDLRLPPFSCRMAPASIFRSDGERSEPYGGMKACYVSSRYGSEC